MTPEQLQVLKTAILAETDVAFVAARNEGNNTTMAAFYSASATPAFYVWRSSVETDLILDTIDWAKLTCTDVATTADSAQVAAAQTNWQLACQGKQINLQIALQGRQTINATRLKTRQMLIDALQNVPSGTGGALQDAGWSQVKQVLYRTVNRGERLFATGTGTTGVPGLAGWEGTISRDDVLAALTS